MYCEICGKKIRKVKRCKMCGRIVCESDFDEVKKICKICSLTLCELCEKQLAIGYCQRCEKLVCEDCSVKINAGYLCKNCYAYLER
ncbi:MAG: hypothetical protein DRJ39_02230 [Thermoprotei archaeon]|nr:hypothetical protein [Thermoproteales archaeon]RLE85028.1 MAG: hypothetical protein DRJ39_02230 [Thermoprotei archaeon]